MVVVIGGDYTDSFDSLAKDLAIPSNTLRRYFKLYQEYIPNKLVKRAVRFNQEAKQLFEDINKMYAQRMTTEEIMSSLAATRKPTLDVRPSPPAPPARQQKDLESLGQLVPVLDRMTTAFEKLVENQERILEEMRFTREAIQAAQGPQESFKASGQGLHHPDQGKPQETPVGDVVVDRGAVIARVLELHGQGLGQHAITTRVRREGLRMSARGQLSKSTVARIIKGDIKS